MSKTEYLDPNEYQNWRDDQQVNHELYQAANAYLKEQRMGTKTNSGQKLAVLETEFECFQWVLDCLKKEEVSKVIKKLESRLEGIGFDIECLNNE